MGYVNLNPGPTTVTNNGIPLNTLPFYKCGEPNMLSERDRSVCSRAQDNSKLKIFEKKGLHILHLNIDSLLPKIDEIRYVAKQSNASIFGISEFKLDSSILFEQ